VTATVTATSEPRIHCATAANFDTLAEIGTEYRHDLHDYQLMLSTADIASVVT